MTDFAGYITGFINTVVYSQPLLHRLRHRELCSPLLGQCPRPRCRAGASSSRGTVHGPRSSTAGACRHPWVRAVTAPCGVGTPAGARSSPGGMEMESGSDVPRRLLQPCRSRAHGAGTACQPCPGPRSFSAPHSSSPPPVGAVVPRCRPQPRGRAPPGRCCRRLARSRCQAGDAGAFGVMKSLLQQCR